MLSNFKEELQKVKIIISEVDGVITENLSYIDSMGNTILKGFYTRDFEAINLLKKTFKFVFVSSDNYVSKAVCEKRNIPFFWAKKKKKDTLVEIFRRYQVSPEEVLYIGCNFSDLECLNLIPLSMCPCDATAEVKDRSSHNLNSFGGCGVISEVYEFLKKERIDGKNA